MTHADQTADAYVAGLSDERRAIIQAVRGLILDNLPAGYEEGVAYGMLAYYVPLTEYPNTYNKQPLMYVALASQKNYISLYLTCMYGDAEQAFRAAYKATGKKLDMGKSCMRFTALNDLPLELIAETIRTYTPQQYIAHYELVKPPRKS